HITIYQQLRWPAVDAGVTESHRVATVATADTPVDALIDGIVGVGKPSARKSGIVIVDGAVNTAETGGVFLNRYGGTRCTADRSKAPLLVRRRIISPLQNVAAVGLAARFHIDGFAAVARNNAVIVIPSALKCPLLVLVTDIRVLNNIRAVSRSRTGNIQRCIAMFGADGVVAIAHGCHLPVLVGLPGVFPLHNVCATGSVAIFYRQHLAAGARFDHIGAIGNGCRTRTG